MILHTGVTNKLTSGDAFCMQLIRSLNIAKSEAEVGHYVGIMVSNYSVWAVVAALNGYGFQQSLFFATEACTVLYWSRLSDHIGRKPVILTGLFGLSISMYCFGLSKTFWGLVLRCVFLDDGFRNPLN